MLALSWKAILRNYIPVIGADLLLTSTDQLTKPLQKTTTNYIPTNGKRNAAKVKNFDSDAVASVKKASDVDDDHMILDIGPETAIKLTAQRKRAGSIDFSGPVSIFSLEQRTLLIGQPLIFAPVFVSIWGFSLSTPR
jgi:3-phosphoglycerate kinase